jgi:apolipoprotein N-acyltransferase
VHGLTLATVLLAATPMLGLRAIGVGGAALALWAGLGVIRLDRPEPPETGLSVVLVQGNVQETDKWSQDLLRQIWMRYLQLTAAGVAKAAGRPSVVVWPETASPALLGVDPEARAAIMQAAAPARAALVGTVRFTDGEPSRAPGNRPLNSLVALVGDGRIAATYDKWHLVPFGEYQPTWFPLPIQVVPGGGFAPGSGPATLQVPGIPPVAPLICYEAIFSAQVVDEADRPAWIVNITNDAWFGNSSGPRQHLAAARMRAVEEGLPLMRAANTGISVGFDAHGHELGRLGIGVTGTLVLPLPGALPPTSFSRWGLVLPGLLALAAIASGLNLGRKRQHPGR